MPRVFLSNKQIKGELKNMLREVDSFLRSNNLQYTIYGGTLLGAVRHKGFIPWDDDIDLGMLRPEYEKLIGILKRKNTIEGSLYGIGYELGEGDWPFIKIVNPRIFVDEKNTGVSKYLWIDIFPVDAAPNRFKKLYFIYLYYFLRRIYFSKRAESFGLDFHKSNNPVKRLYNWFLTTIGKKVNTNSIIEKYIHVCKWPDIRSAEFYSENVWGTWQFPKNIFDNYISYEFEDLIVSGIEKNDDYLRILYGNYMDIPPENMRMSHEIIAWEENNEE